MTRLQTSPRRSRTFAVAAAALAAAVGTFAFVSPGLANAKAPASHHHHGSRSVPAPPANPTSASQIQNLDQVETAIKAYYGDTPAPGTDPVTGNPTTLDFASPTSAYAHEMAGIESKAARYLRHQAREHHGSTANGKRAIVFDIDDTTLNTFDYEIYSSFVFDPTSNAAFVNAEAFPAVFGMPALEAAAQHLGYQIFWITGRPISQVAGTTGNLTKVGYAVDPTHLFLKDNSDPWLASCAPTCTTDQYKSLTRQHIQQAFGDRIVANFGDQFSDLSNGFAKRDFKVPNPMYFIP
jgi:HAD superfamily, subfamily IIIB (Acid phosphatase)